MRLYVNKASKVICVTEKVIKCPEHVWGVGEYEADEVSKKFQQKMFLLEGFEQVTTKKFKDSLKLKK